MPRPRRLSSIVVAGSAIVAAAVLPTAVLAQQTGSAAASPSDTAKASGIRSDADTSAGEAVKPAGSVMVLPPGAVQQLLQQMVNPRGGRAKATPRVGQSADSTRASKKSSDSTAADSTND